ncbi:MAG: alpha/beta hydrolase [Bdellovibrionales bacterium]|nr:alpha/beta hydrolase [Bdellovibrionales bacterium]
MSYLEQFHYQITGNPQGHKLVFLHGLMGAGANWRPVAKAFDAEFNILTFDQRGHGRSFQPATGYSPRDYAQDLKLILDELGWTDIGLVGHSMGGRNALEFALHFSQRVKGLVIEDIGPEASSEAMGRIQKMIDLVPVPFASREQAREFFTNNYPNLISWSSQAQTVSRFFHSNIVEQPDGTHDWRFSRSGIRETMEAGRREDRWDALRNLKMPVLLVRGEFSTDLPRPVFDRMKQVLPQAEAVEIAGAGHWVHFDQSAAFIAALKSFFHGVFGTSL